MDVYINDIYYHILYSDATVIINYGGRDSGKSYFVGGQYLPLRMHQDEYFRGICVRKTYASLKDSCYQEVLDGIKHMGMEAVYQKPLRTPMEITHKNGNKLLFRGLDDPTKIKSLKGISFIWVEEAEDLSEREFYDLLILLRAGDRPTLILTFNPVDEDHFTNAMFVESVADRVLQTFEDGDKKVWQKRIESRVEGKVVPMEALIVRSTYEDNSFISQLRKAAIEQLAGSDPFLYDVYKKGKFGTRGGRILTNVVQRDLKAEGLRFKKFDNRGYVQDFGYNHANAILAVAEKDGCLYVFDELYGCEKDTAEWIAEADRIGLEKRLRMICDSASPGPIKTWRRAGYRATGVKKYSGSVLDQINKLKAYKSIYVDVGCKNTYKEAKNWKWKENHNGRFTDEPVAIYDDAMAALRYSADLFAHRNFSFK